MGEQNLGRKGVVFSLGFWLFERVDETLKGCSVGKCGVPTLGVPPRGRRLLGSVTCEVLKSPAETPGSRPPQPCAEGVSGVPVPCTELLL